VKRYCNEVSPIRVSERDQDSMLSWLFSHPLTKMVLTSCLWSIFPSAYADGTSCLDGALVRRRTSPALNRLLPLHA